MRLPYDDSWVDLLFRAPAPLKAQALTHARSRGISLESLVREALWAFLHARRPEAAAFLPPPGPPSELVPSLKVKEAGQIWTKFPAAWCPVVDSLIGGGCGSRGAVVRESLFVWLEAASSGEAQEDEP